MQVDVALDIVDKMCQAGFELSTHVLQSILQICEEAYDYILVSSPHPLPFFLRVCVLYSNLFLSSHNMS